MQECLLCLCVYGGVFLKCVSNVNLNVSVGIKRPQSWKASSRERDTSSLASSSELMSSMQVISWLSRWRRSILDLELWDAELLVLSERTRGLCMNRSIFEKRLFLKVAVLCIPWGQEELSRITAYNK